MSKKKEDGKEKKKEQKIVYIDDGSTVADMSGTFKKDKKTREASRATFKERWATYWGVVKKMIFPLLITLLGLTLFYILLITITGSW